MDFTISKPNENSAFLTQKVMLLSPAMKKKIYFSPLFFIFLVILVFSLWNLLSVNTDSWNIDLKYTHAHTHTQTSILLHSKRWPVNTSSSFIFYSISIANDLYKLFAAFNSRYTTRSRARSMCGTLNNTAILSNGFNGKNGNAIGSKL